MGKSLGIRSICPVGQLLEREEKEAMKSQGKKAGELLTQ